MPHIAIRSSRKLLFFLMTNLRRSFTLILLCYSVDLQQEIMDHLSDQHNSNTIGLFHPTTNLININETHHNIYLEGFLFLTEGRLHTHCFTMRKRILPERIPMLIGCSFEVNGTNYVRSLLSPPGAYLFQALQREAYYRRALMRKGA